MAVACHQGAWEMWSLFWETSYPAESRNFVPEEEEGGLGGQLCVSSRLSYLFGFFFPPKLINL